MGWVVYVIYYMRIIQNNTLEYFNILIVTMLMIKNFNCVTIHDMYKIWNIIGISRIIIYKSHQKNYTNWWKSTSCTIE